MASEGEHITQQGGMKMLSKMFTEFDQLYRTHKKWIVGLSGLGLVMLISLYLYHRMQTTKPGASNGTV